MKSPDMNQYITLLFSLLADFFATQNPTPRRRGLSPASVHAKKSLQVL